MADNDAQGQQDQDQQQTGGTPDTKVEDDAASQLLAKWLSEGTDDGKGGKEAVLADLAKERKERQALAQKLSEMEQAQKGQTDALAKALGIKTEGDEKPDVAAQIAAIQQQLADSQRKATLLEVAAAPGEDADGKALPAIPREFHNLLTATETEALQEQARTIAALLKASGKAAETPGFVQSNGQGNNDGKTPHSLTRDELKQMAPEAIVEARKAGQLDHLLNPTAQKST